MTSLESMLMQYRPVGSLRDQLADSFVWPHYEGYSLAGIPSTVAMLLGADPVPTTGPLHTSLWESLAGGIERVVLILIDGMGWCRLQHALTHDPALPLHRWQERGLFAPITSVFPSTTVVAMTTLWTGAVPAQHGIVGTRAFLREYSTLCNLLWFTPEMAPDRWLLLDWGLEPESFVPIPGFAEHLARAGVPTYGFIHMGYEDSGLSRLCYRGIQQLNGFLGVADMFISLRELLESRTGERFYAAVYWGYVDGLSHRYSPRNERWGGELRSLLHGLETELLDRLTPQARRGTLLILTADHGQLLTPKDSAVFLKDHPRLQDSLCMDPGGEARAPFLYADDSEAVRTYITAHLSEAFVCLDAAEAQAAGLFGPGTPMPEVRRRLGDFILPARGNYTLHWGRKEFDMMGRHGGLSPEEMLVPWFVMRLDG